MIRFCLQALAEQQNVSPDEYEVILVLDGCTDRTETRAKEVQKAYPQLRLFFVEGPGVGAGQARRVGMEAACGRLLGLGKPRALISSTDADTIVEPDWLVTQLELADCGSQAIGGRIQLEDTGGLTQGVANWHSNQGRTRHENLLAGSEDKGRAEHWQFSGASMALTAEVYERIGGLEPRTALEDENLERALLQAGVPIDRPLSVKVKTSARLVGRASRGLARDLALASWIEHNTYRADSYVPLDPTGHRDATVSIIVPFVEPVSGVEAFLSGVAAIVESGAADEAVLISGVGEISSTPLGISCFRGQDLMPDFGPLRGRGDALWRGLSATTGEIVMFLDPTRRSNAANRFSRLIGPLMERERLEMVKGFCLPPSQLGELVIRPFINLHLPHLAGFVDPAYPEFAAHRTLLEQVMFPVGRGADVSTLLDASQIAGLEALAQAELNAPETSRPEGGAEAYALLTAATSRTKDDGGQENLVPGPLLTPGKHGFDVERVPVEERPALKSFHKVCSSP